MRNVLILLIILLSSTVSIAAERVGMPLPMTGRLSPVGESIALGAKAAAKDLMEQGKSIQLLFADDTCNEKNTAGIASELDASDLIVGSVCFPTARTLADTLNKPVIALGTQSQGLARLRTIERLNLFEVSPDPEAEARAIVEQLFSRFEGKPFALLDDGSVYGRTLSDNLKLIGEKAGYLPLVVENFRPFQTSLQPMLRKLDQSGVEALFVIAGAEDLITISRDMRKLNYDWTVGTDNRAELIEYTPGFLDVKAGWLMLKKTLPDFPIEIIEKLYDAPILEAAANGYAMIQIAAQFNGELEAQTFNTILGPITFSAGRASIENYLLYRWDGRRFVPGVGN